MENTLKKLTGGDKIYMRNINDYCASNSNSGPRNGDMYCSSDKQTIGSTLYNNDIYRVKSGRVGSKLIPRTTQHTSINITIPNANDESNDESDDDIPKLVENVDCYERDIYKNTEEDERKQNEISNEIMALLKKEIDNNK